MKYAVVKISGHQYKVEEGQEVLVDKLNLASKAGKLPDPKKINAQVLLSVKDDKVEIGTPVLKDAKISFKVLKDLEKGEKIDVMTYKAKSRYRRKKGYRHSFTRLLVEKIA